MKNNEKFYFTIVVIGLPVLIYIFFFSQKQRSLYKKLEYDGILDTAVIVREFIGAKSKLYFEYMFYVNNKEYNGLLQYSKSFRNIKVGDSLLIKYLKEDPGEVNKPLSNKDIILPNREMN